MNIRRTAILGQRIFKTGVLNFIRNAWLGMAAIAVMVITLTIILFSIIGNATLSKEINTITDRIDISVYLKDEVNDKQREQLIKQIKNLDNVKSVTYLSKQEALDVYRQQNKDNPDLLQAINQTDNPLPASLQIKPQDAVNFESIRTFLEQKDIKALQSEETSYSGTRKEAIDNITQSTNFFQKAGIVGVITFAVISMLIIFNTIQMAIFNRRDELTIMRLLGASTNFIRGPFVVETLLYGIVSALASIAIIHFIFGVAAKALDASTFGVLDISFAYQYFIDRFWPFLGMQLAIGILIGTVSSFIATRRYLKFKTSK